MQLVPLLICGTCDEHPCLCYKPIGLTCAELEELSTLADNTGLRGDALRQKWMERNAPDPTCDGTHAWTAIQSGKSKSEIKEIVHDEYPGESLDLFYAVHELYQMGAFKQPPGGRWSGSAYMPVSQNKERIKHLMMLHQIIPWSKREGNLIPSSPLKKRKKMKETTPVHMSF